MDKNDVFFIMDIITNFNSYKEICEEERIKLNNANSKEDIKIILINSKKIFKQFNLKIFIKSIFIIICLIILILFINMSYNIDVSYNFILIIFLFYTLVYLLDKYYNRNIFFKKIKKYADEILLLFNINDIIVY